MWGETLFADEPASVYASKDRTLTSAHDVLLQVGGKWCCVGKEDLCR